MDDWQLIAVIGVPSLITLMGMAQNNTRFEAMDKRMDVMDRTIGMMQAETGLIRHDMQQFFRDLGRHEEAIDHLKSKR